MNLTVTPCTDRESWDRVVNDLGGHPLQLWGWGELKSAHRWSAERVLVQDELDQTVGACQLLTRSVPGPLGGFVYAPRGPVFRRNPTDQLVPDSVPAAEEITNALADYVQGSRRTVAISIEPDENSGVLKIERPWREAKTTVLPARTLILDLQMSEDDLLRSMSKKHRQYIRKSSREESLSIRQVKSHDELDACLEVYRDTSDRANFGLHEDSYYHDAFSMLGKNAPVWASYQEGKPVAFLFLAHSRRTAFELYGGMNESGQQLRANYALKWHAIRAMKSKGVARYDFGGLINDGVTTFKTGFASHENLLAGTWDRPGHGYMIWAEGLPLAKKVLRAVKR